MKERLLGAAVLVLAAVLIVPVLLDGPDQDDSEVTRNLELPAPESTPARTHVVELDTRESDSVTETLAEDTLPVAEPTASAPTENTRPATVQQPAAPRPAEPGPAEPGPAEPGSAEPAEAPDGVQQGWAVQVGSFTSEPNARRLAGLLQASDYPAFVMRSVIQGRVMYRVRVGPEPDRAGAEALAERLQADRQRTQLVQHP